MNSQEEKRLSDEEVNLFCTIALEIVQRPVGDITEEETDILKTLISNTQFFQRNLDSKINYDDFMQRVKHLIDYETYPRGTIIFHEGQYANKLCVIIKGSAVRFHQRPIAEVEEEAFTKQKQTMKEKEEEEYMAKRVNAYEAIQQMSLTQLDGSSSRRLHRSSTSVTRFKLTKGMSKEEELKGSSNKRPGLLVSPTIEHLNSESEDMEEELNEQGELDRTPLSCFSDESPEKSNSDDSPMLRVKLMKSPLDFGSQISFGKAKKQNSFKRKEGKKLARKQTMEETKILELQEAAEVESEHEAEDQRDKDAIKKFKEMQARESDIELFHEIVKKNIKITTKYFVGDIIKVHRTREYHPGNHFGESFLRANRGKENLLVAQEEIHLLTISKEGYLKVINQLYDKVKEKIEFIAKVLSSVEEDALGNFAYYFKEKAFQKGEKIYSEDDQVDNLFLLRSGNVKLFKKPENKQIQKPKLTHSESLSMGSNRSPKSEIPVSSVVEGQFFGEELVLKEDKRQYTAIASTSGTRVYFLEGWVYQKIKGVFTTLLKTLRTQAKEKLNWRQTRIGDMMESVKEVKGAQTQIAQTPQVKISQAIPSEFQERRSIIWSNAGSEASSPRLRMNGSLPDIMAIPSLKFDSSPQNKKNTPYLSMARSSIQDEVIMAESPEFKNLTMYKDKYYRKTFSNKVAANETHFKKNDYDSSNFISPFTFTKDLDTNSSIRRSDKKHLSETVAQHPPSLIEVTKSPKDELKDGKELSRGPKEGSLQYLDSGREPPAQANIPSLKTFRSNIIEFLAPKYQEGNEEVIKKPNGSIFIVSGRSKLRGILKTLEHIPDLCTALHTPKPSSGSLAALSPTALRRSPTTAKLKAISKVHKIRHLKSPEPSPTKHKSEPLSAGLLTKKLKIPILKEIKK